MRRNQLSATFAWLFMSFVLVLILALCAAAKPKYKVLHGFKGGGRDGGYPQNGGLIFDVRGNLYGAITAGVGAGTVFELMPAKGHWREKILHGFTTNTDGGEPNNDLIFDGAGNLYGTTSVGGAGNGGGGTIFELVPSRQGWSLTVLYVFCTQYGCPEGVPPAAGVVRDLAGNLYGTAVGGGPYYDGVAFELSPGVSGWSYTDLHDFDGEGGRNDGKYPYARLTFDAAGNLYGTTANGDLGYGTVFELKPDGSGGWKEKILYWFKGKPAGDGEEPFTDVVFDSSGNLYGTTLAGGIWNDACEGGCGIVFKLSPSPDGHWKESILYKFSQAATGVNPSSRVVFDKAGNIYGTAGGGTGVCGGGCGVVYKLAPQANGKWKYSVLHKFNFSDGGYPGGGLIFDQKGNLYGTASIGGPGGAGVVFEITR
jgi:uncharacterized repeat protein (TIGR03803 family)